MLANEEHAVTCQESAVAIAAEGPSPSEGLLKITEVAARLGIAHQTLRGWIYKDQFCRPTLKLGSTRRWSWSDVEKWMAAQE